MCPAGLKGKDPYDSALLAQIGTTLYCVYRCASYPTTVTINHTRSSSGLLFAHGSPVAFISPPPWLRRLEVGSVTIEGVFFFLSTVSALQPNNIHAWLTEEQQHSLENLVSKAEFNDFPYRPTSLGSSFPLNVHQLSLEILYRGPSFFVKIE